MIGLQYYNYSRTAWLIVILVISYCAPAASHVLLLTETMWGRNPNPESKFGDVSEIVIYDFNAKSEMLSKSLGTITSTFQVDPSGSKLYFLDADQQQVRVLDIERKEIAVFADLEKAKMPDPELTFVGVSFRTILDAY